MLYKYNVCIQKLCSKSVENYSNLLYKGSNLNMEAYGTGVSDAADSIDLVLLTLLPRVRNV